MSRINESFLNKGKQTLRRTIKYRPQLITRDDLIKLKIRLSKLRNNWRLCDRETLIYRLEKITNLTMDTAIRIQETRARVIHVSSGKPINNVSSITRRLGKIKKQISGRRQQTIKNIRRLKNKISRLARARDKLIRKLKARIASNELELWSRVRLHERASDKKDQKTEEHNNIKTLDDLNKLAGTVFPQEPDESLERVPIDLASQYEPILINDQELRVVEHMVRNKKYTGPEGLRFSVFNRILELEPEIIRDIARISYITNHIPDHCKTTQGTLIPEKVPGKFRVLHVASPLTAYLELITLNRLETALETKRLKDPNQFGFCRGKGRHDLLAVLIAETAKHRVLVRERYSD